MPNQQLKEGLIKLQQAYDGGDVAGSGRQLTVLKVSLAYIPIYVSGTLIDTGAMVECRSV